MGLKIIGTGSYVPEKVLTNHDLEKMVDTNDEWIKTRSGIEERRICSKDQGSVHMGLKAAKRALEMAKTTAEEIDLIIFGTITPDYNLPTNSCLIQKHLKAKNAACFDMQAACSGFVYGLEIASAMALAKKKYKKVLLIGGEKLSAVTDWTDRGTCILFGDAAGAVVIEKTEDDKNFLLSSNIHADGKHDDLLMIPDGGTVNPITKENVETVKPYIQMTGNKVLKLAVRSMVTSSQEALNDAGITSDDVKWLIPHQANVRILQGVASRLKIEVERVPLNLVKYGNTSAASIILSLDEYVRAGKIVEGDKILLTAFGGGMTWGSAVLEW